MMKHEYTRRRDGEKRTTIVLRWDACQQEVEYLEGLAKVRGFNTLRQFLATTLDDALNIAGEEYEIAKKIARQSEC